MTLSKISTALQRGEALTDEQKARTICALRGWAFKGLVEDGFSNGFYFTEPGSETVQADAWIDYRRHFTSVDAALAFVAKVFPRQVNIRLFRATFQSEWHCSIGLSFHPYGAFNTTAPTPSAAIMAAAIEAHLAKGDTK